MSLLLEDLGHGESPKVVLFRMQGRNAEVAEAHVGCDEARDVLAGQPVRMEWPGGGPPLFLPVRCMGLAIGSGDGGTGEEVFRGLEQDGGVDPGQVPQGHQVGEFLGVAGGVAELFGIQ